MLLAMLISQDRGVALRAQRSYGWAVSTRHRPTGLEDERGEQALSALERRGVVSALSKEADAAILDHPRVGVELVRLVSAVSRAREARWALSAGREIGEAVQ
jgi:hypothetical protein